MQAQFNVFQIRRLSGMSFRTVAVRKPLSSKYRRAKGEIGADPITGIMNRLFIPAKDRSLTIGSRSASLFSSPFSTQGDSRFADYCDNFSYRSRSAAFENGQTGITLRVGLVADEFVSGPSLTQSEAAPEAVAAGFVLERTDVVNGSSRRRSLTGSPAIAAAAPLLRADS